MRLRVNTTDGSNMTIQDFPDEDILEVLDAVDAGQPRLTFTLDNGKGVAHIMAAHITRIDVEEP